MVCPAPNACTTAYAANGTSVCTPTYAPASATCNDGNPGTYADHCDGSGSCAGTPVACPATNACTTAYTANGTSACTPTYAPASAACNDGNLGTYGDQCNGSGGCTGWQSGFS